MEIAGKWRKTSIVTYFICFSRSKHFMLSLDVSPIIAQEKDNFKLDESFIFGCFDPLNEDNRNLLSHPVMNTYIMMKYNSYAVFVLATLVLKLCYAVSLSGLVLTSSSMINFTECSTGNQLETLDLQNFSSDFKSTSLFDFRSEPSFMIWSIFTGVMTMIMLRKEVLEMINDGKKWFNVHNLGQLLLVLLIVSFLSIIAVGKSSYYCWLKYISAVAVFAVWMDFTMSLRSLVFGKWSSLGFYILMLKEVTHLYYDFLFFFIFSGCTESFHVLLYLLLHNTWIYICFHDTSPRSRITICR